MGRRPGLRRGLARDCPQTIVANEQWCLGATAVPALTFLVAWRSLKQERVWTLQFALSHTEYNDKLGAIAW
ncbi:hypothetical protein IFM47457_07513 [Aspergillus lentulus]|nr:hypothetical protein IFM47457_07513 [Aspergillus lentulus]